MNMQKNLSENQILETKYKNARTNLLLVVVFTVINILLLISQSDSYFLFSAYIPYALVSIGMILCGMYPSEYYGEAFLSMEFMSTSVFMLFAGIAIIFTALYFVSWIFSKNKKGGWLIFALVLFAIDTVGMFAFMGFELGSLIDIVFHVWVIISLVSGIKVCSKIKEMPAQDVAVPEIEQMEEHWERTFDSNIKRVADANVKSRILLENNALGHTITYRRVKRVNELVIDGNVYDEIEALVEFAHSLNARIDGHSIEVGFDGKIHSYLKIDGQIVARKLRLY